MFWTQKDLSSNPSPTRSAKNRVMHGVNGTQMPGWLGGCDFPVHVYPRYGSWWWAWHRAGSPRGDTSF